VIRVIKLAHHIWVGGWLAGRLSVPSMCGCAALCEELKRCYCYSYAAGPSHLPSLPPLSPSTCEYCCLPIMPCIHASSYRLSHLSASLLLLLVGCLFVRCPWLSLVSPLLPSLSPLSLSLFPLRVFLRWLVDSVCWVGERYLSGRPAFPHATQHTARHSTCRWTRE